MDTQKAQHLGILLADSLLADEVKRAIMENLAIMPMSVVDKLIVSLEAEKGYMSNAVKELEDFVKDQEKAWATLAAKQKKETERITSEEILKIELGMLAETNKNTGQ